MYQRVPNITREEFPYIPPKPKKQYKITKSGWFKHTQVVTLLDDYDPAVDSIEDCIDLVISDDMSYETNTSNIKEL